MERVSNINCISMEYIDDPDFQSELKTVSVGDAAGCEKIYVNVDYVKPGGKSAKYHSHSKQEEFFLIMSGTGILKICGDEIPIKAGDVISKPAGKNIAHQFINNGSNILQILDVGTREKGDVVTYPDENIVYVKDEKLVFNIKDSVKGWTSDPNK